jgi:biopolymer transport protein ExbB
MNFFAVFKTGDVVLIATFLLLLGLSVANWYVFILKFFEIQKELKSLKSFLKINNLQNSKHGFLQKISLDLESLIKKDNFLKLSAFENRNNNYFENYKKTLFSNLNLFATSSVTAPFIGLFGTVWGIYNALINISKDGSASLEIVAGPVGEALIATALGLFVAIPASLFFNYFSSKINHIVSAKKKHVEKLISQIILN